MAYTVRHQRRDGSVKVTRHVDGVPYVIRSDRESVLDKYPTNPQSGATAGAAKRNIAEHLKAVRADARENKGWTPGKEWRHAYSIPAEVYNHVMRNEGPEAARDSKYLARAAKKMGFDCRVHRGRV